jgi:uncharacterized protein (TIGR00255 family)
MTGFGTGRASNDERTFVLEARSVNHRYCDVRLHLPRDLVGLESRLEGRVRKRVDRGRIDVSLEVSLSEGVAARVDVDLIRARAYRDALSRLAEELSLAPEVPLALVASAPGVIREPGTIRDLDALAPAIEAALDAALTDLNEMREREGRALAEEIQGRLASARALLEQVRTHVPRSNAERRARLEQRLAELLGDRSLDAARVAQEVAILADRADVSEELARLTSHLDQLDRLTRATEPVGRKLDFLLQETHREVNTIGSKTTSAEISHLVVELKAELERTREQVQNVE